MAKKKKATTEEKIERQASEEELRIAFDGPAIAANRYFINVGPAGVRIAFTEQRPPSPPIFRSAVMLAHQDAVNLKNLLVVLLKDVEEKIAAAAKENG